MIALALLSWLVTARASLGRHSRIHDAIARVAMLLEGVLLWAAANGDGRAWMLAALVGMCFLGVGLTDTNKGEVEVMQWARRRLWRVE